MDTSTLMIPSESVSSYKLSSCLLWFAGIVHRVKVSEGVLRRTQRSIHHSVSPPSRFFSGPTLQAFLWRLSRTSGCCSRWTKLQANMCFPLAGAAEEHIIQPATIQLSPQQWALSLCFSARRWWHALRYVPGQTTVKDFPDTAQNHELLMDVRMRPRPLQQSAWGWRGWWKTFSLVWP